MDPFTHKTFIIATMWHEGEEEMRLMLRSLMDLSKETLMPKEEYESHIVFDDGKKMYTSYDVIIGQLGNGDVIRRA